jgi:hypothetical protein
MVLACIFAFDIACYIFRFATRTLLEGHGLVQVGVTLITLLDKCVTMPEVIGAGGKEQQRGMPGQHHWQAYTSASNHARGLRRGGGRFVSAARNARQPQ